MGKMNLVVDECQIHELFRTILRVYVCTHIDTSSEYKDRHSST